eukprot:CAMPEP_0202969060 /NCGR_PEP_ID=MMETSP1396-20130829/14650_1 /ASSEMBLY_ACC=CAM_ASM_000872 /TAXON_ID= /ORGANISM="Pseudokeronopsis sp., Strain Brazil" /LENGTH=40 /DNA_ID= /DNA_START= /DNA_END= /DNA_ORIENTATION=
MEEDVNSNEDGDESYEDEVLHEKKLKEYQKKQKKQYKATK